MAYGQWITMELRPHNFPILGLKNAYLEHGKFYVCGNKDIELNPAVIDSVRINAGKSEPICSCGRDNALYGTEGRFDLYNTDEAGIIATIVWSDSYSAGIPNEFKIINQNRGYYFNAYPWPNTDGVDPLGSTIIDIGRIHN